MDQVGYSLVDQDGTEVQFWGDTYGQCVEVPKCIRLPNGDDVHCPEVGATYDGLKLVARFLPRQLDPPAMTPQEKIAALGLSPEDIRAVLGL